MVKSNNTHNRVLHNKSRSEELLKEVDEYIERNKIKRSSCSTLSLEEIRARITELEKELELLKKSSGR